MWEIYVQFHYDKRMTAQFACLDAPQIEIDFSMPLGIIEKLAVQNISEINFVEVDAFICLTSRKIFKGRVIYLDMLTDYFKRKTYAEIPLLNFLQRYPRVKLFLTNFPNFERFKGSHEFKQRLMSLEDMKKFLHAHEHDNTPTAFNRLGYTNAQSLEIVEAPKVTTNPDGSTDMQDTDEHSLMRIQNGRRATAYQPAHYRNKIYFVGSCHHYGVNAPFDKTIESYLQKMLNEKNLPYRVENESQRYCYRYQDIFYNLNKLTPAPGDIMFVWIHNLATMNLPFFDVADAFDPPHDYREIYCVQGHVNELGYKILAEKYFAFLTANNFFRDVEFKYSTPPPQRTDTVFRRNLNRAA